MSQRLTRRWPCLALLALACGAAGYAVAPASAVANSDGYYCGVQVFPQDDCNVVGVGVWGENTWNGRFNDNHAYRPNTEANGVCEHTYIYGTSTTVSKQCGVGYVTSFCDLYFDYNSGYSFTAHAGNNSATLTLQIDGHVVNDSPEQSCA